MAIEKVKKAKIEISMPAVIQLGVAAALAVLSIVFGYMAFVRWRFKVNLVSGYEYYDANEVENARKSLEAALSWREEHTGARELLAKLQCDLKQLDGAEAHYNRLLDQGYSVPQVHAGLGVVFLKKADAATDPQEVASRLKQARECFERAGSVPEASIGLGHADLLEAERVAGADDPKRYEAAIQRFAKVRQEMEGRQEYRAECTREGVIDYYSGLGKALAYAATTEERQVAASAFRSCSQMEGRWTFPLCNLLAMETRRFAEGSFSNPEMLGLKAEITAFRREMSLWKSQREVYADLKEPWLHHSFAVAKAFIEAGDVSGYDAVVRDLTGGGGFNDRLDPYLFDAGCRTRLALADEAAALVERHMSDASKAYRTLLGQSLIRDDSAKLHRALANNNLGWTMAWLGSYAGNETRLREAQGYLGEAAKLFPEDYVFNRNLCVVLKRLRRPDREIQPFLEKASAADKGSLAEDFTRFQQYMGGP